MHCIQQLKKRNITQQSVLDVIENAGEKVLIEDVSVYQKTIVENGRHYLIRVFVNEDKIPPLIITAYKTSKIDKYWFMKIKYDKQTDVLYIQLNNNPIAESGEDKKGIILDYDRQNNIVGIEILNASSKLPQPNVVEYEMAS